MNDQQFKFLIDKLNRLQASVKSLAIAAKISKTEGIQEFQSVFAIERAQKADIAPTGSCDRFRHTCATQVLDNGVRHPLHRNSIYSAMKSSKPSRSEPN